MSPLPLVWAHLPLLLSGCSGNGPKDKTAMEYLHTEPKKRLRPNENEVIRERIQSQISLDITEEHKALDPIEDIVGTTENSIYSPP